MNKSMMSSLMPLHLIGLTLCLTLLGVGYWIGIRPAASQQSSESDLRQAYAQADASLREGEVELRRAQAQYEQLKLTQSSHALILAPAGQLNEQLAELASLAEACGLSTTRTKVGNLTASQTHRYLQIELGGHGPLAGVSTLLGKIHTEHPDVAVQLIDLSRDASTGSARFELKLIWFVAESVQHGQSATASVTTPE